MNTIVSNDTTDKQFNIHSIIDSFIAALPCYIKEKLVFLSCES
ncbi:hypothetical protein ACER0A_009815 [Haloimpatiens sp. FM7315]